MIDAIAALSATLSDLQSLAAAAGSPQLDQPQVIASTTGSQGPSFSAALRAAIGQVDGTISSASAAARSFAGGNHDIPLSDVMVSLEQANLALQLAANGRDKVVAAYTNIMNMQV